MTKTRERKSVSRFVGGESSATVTAPVRPRRSNQSEESTKADIADIVTRIFTDADKTFFKPVRLKMGSAKLRSPYAQHEWTYAAITARSTAISQVPLAVLRGDRNDPEDNSIPVEQGNEWVRLFQKPNPLTDGTMFKEAIEVFLNICGEAFAVAVTADGSPYVQGSNKAPAELWLVHPSNMQHVVGKHTGILLGWKYKPPGSAVEIEYTLDEVLQWKLFDPDNPFRGLAPMSPISQSIRTDFKAGVFDEALLDNSGSPGGVLTSDMDLSPEHIQQIRTEWNKRHTGSRKAGHTAVLGGGLKYSENQFKAKDMQFLEKRKWTREGVLAVFGTPPLAIGLDDDVNRNTATIVRRMWWTDKLIPRLNLIAEGINSHFFDPVNSNQGPRGRVQNRNLFVRFDLSGVEALREDFGEQLGHAKELKGLGYGLNDINARLNLGMPDVEWGEEPLEEPTQVPISLLYDEPGAFVSTSNQGAVLEEAEGKGIEAARDNIIMVRKLTSGEVRKKRIARALVKQFFEPSEARLHRALKRAYSRIRQKQVARIAVEAKTMAAETALARLRAHSTKVDEEIGKLRPEDVKRLLLSEREWSEITRKELDAPIERVMLDALGQVGGELGGFTVATPDAKTFTRLHARRIAAMVKVNKAVRRDIRTAIIKAITDGSINDVRGVMRELKKSFKQLSEGRAMTIARTETGILGNTTRFEAMKMEGVKQHEWINAGDEFVRPTDPSQQGNHRKVDGEVVDIGEKFSNGLLYPLDPSGPAFEIINCRCAAVAVLSLDD